MKEIGRERDVDEIMDWSWAKLFYKVNKAAAQIFFLKLQPFSKDPRAHIYNHFTYKLIDQRQHTIHWQLVSLCLHSVATTPSRLEPMELSNKMLEFFTNFGQWQNCHLIKVKLSLFQTKSLTFWHFTIFSILTNFDPPSMNMHSFLEIHIIIKYIVDKSLTFQS